MHSPASNSPWAQRCGLVLRLQEAVEGELTAIAQRTAEVFLQGGKVLFCGNGGSAAEAQHLSGELQVRLRNDRTRRALAGLALTVDGSVLTAAANDFSYDAVFSRQIEALGKAGDMLIALTTSGESSNIIHAVQTAGRMGLITVVFGSLRTSRCNSDFLKDIDYHLIVPDTDTALIQEAHLIAGHIYISMIEEILGATEIAEE